METNEQYHDRGDISASDLKVMAKSWRKFEAHKILKTLRREPTPAMELGTAIHAAVLEPERFAHEFVTEPELDRRTKAYKEWKSSVHQHMTCVRKTDMATVVSCRDSLYRHPIIRPYLEADGRCEVSHYWTDAPTDVPCKFRPDKIIPKAGVILDLKTTQDVDGFDRACADFGYHLQAAHYLSGAEEKYGGEDWVFLFAIVETNPPYRCRAVCLDEESLGVGFDTRERLLSEYVHRLNNDDWMDEIIVDGERYTERELITMKLPNWFLRKA